MIHSWSKALQSLDLKMLLVSPETRFRGHAGQRRLISEFFIEWEGKTGK